MWPEAAPTPEEAARGGIPERYARALAVAYSPDGNHAVVLLGTNEEPYLYPYQVVCGRGKAGWVEEIGGDGPGWSTTADDPCQLGAQNLGVGTLWDESPPGVTGALVSFLEREFDVPVTNGYFLAVVWGVPEGEMPSFVRWIT